MRTDKKMSGNAPDVKNVQHTARAEMYVDKWHIRNDAHVSPSRLCHWLKKHLSRVLTRRKIHIYIIPNNVLRFNAISFQMFY